MWNNAGLSTSILITTRSPANGMVHHTVANIFVSTKLRDLGPKSSAARTFWRMVARCIRYQPPTKHLLWDLTTFSLASVKTPCVGTGFLGLAPPVPVPCHSDDIPELPYIPPICPGDAIPVIGDQDILGLAIITPLPPMGFLESILLSLEEGQLLSESTLRRLRRKEAEIRAAAAEGRTPLSEQKRRKQKRMAARASTSQATCGPSSGEETLMYQEPILTSPQKHSHQKPTMQFVEVVSLFDSERRKVSVEDIERLAASASVHRRRNRQGIAPSSQVQAAASATRADLRVTAASVT